MTIEQYQLRLKNAEQLKINYVKNTHPQSYGYSTKGFDNEINFLKKRIAKLS